VASSPLDKPLERGALHGPHAHAPQAPHAPHEPGGHVEQFDSPARRSEAVILGMWVFLATEILFFGGLFGVYGVYRYEFHDAFREASRHLDFWLGTVNTLVLLTSSLTMALAVQAAAMNNSRRTVYFLLGTIGLGVVFLGIKGLEYYHKYEHHLLPIRGLPFQWEGDPALADGARLFIGLYLGMTGLHALHMIIGIGMLGTFAYLAGKPKLWFERRDTFDVLGLYWHFVDLVWIFLFPLLYLIDRT
jgi:cytochrome c oxidase subunit III